MRQETVKKDKRLSGKDRGFAPNRIAIGERLFQARRAKRLSKNALADMLEVSTKQIYHWEYGFCLPRRCVWNRMNRLLEISVEQILMENGVSVWPELQDFSSVFGLIRALKGMTSEEMAEFVHASVSSVIRWEQDRMDPQKHCWEELGQILGVDVRQIVYDGQVLLTLRHSTPPAYEEYGVPARVESIGEMIHRLRTKERFSQAALASELHISTVQVHQWEKNLRVPALALWPALSELLHVSFFAAMREEGRRAQGRFELCLNDLIQRYQK